MLRANLRRAFLDPAFPGIKLCVRSSGLHTYLALLEEFVPYIRAQVDVRFAADLRRGGVEPDDPEFAEKLSDQEVLTEHHISGNFHGAFVIALTAELEASVTDLANYVRARERSGLSLYDLRESSTLGRFALYVETLLREPLAVPAEALAGLRELQTVRNILAHANGALAQQRQERVDQVLQIARRDGSLVVDDGYVLVQPQFLRASLAHVDAYLSAAMEQLERRYPVGGSGAA